MLATILKLTTSDAGTTLSALFGIWLAWFGNGVLSTTIAALLIINLLIIIVVT